MMLCITTPDSVETLVDALLQDAIPEIAERMNLTERQVCAAFVKTAVMWTWESVPEVTAEFLKSVEAFIAAERAVDAAWGNDEARENGLDWDEGIEAAEDAQNRVFDALQGVEQ